MNLSNNEVKVLRVLWSAKRALPRKDILSLNKDDSWDTRSIHTLLNSMMEKGAVREAGYVRCGKNWGRTYEAAVSYGDYCLSVLSPVKDIINYSLFFDAVLSSRGVDERTLERIKTEIESEKSRI